MLRWRNHNHHHRQDDDDDTAVEDSVVPFGSTVRLTQLESIEYDSYVPNDVSYVPWRPLQTRQLLDCYYYDCRSTDSGVGVGVVVVDLVGVPSSFSSSSYSVRVTAGTLIRARTTTACLVLVPMSRKMGTTTSKTRKKKTRWMMRMIETVPAEC